MGIPNKIRETGTRGETPKVRQEESQYSGMVTEAEIIPGYIAPPSSQVNSVCEQVVSVQIGLLPLTFCESVTMLHPHAASQK